ncbi:MAG: Zn-dependent hydrolase [Desulfobacterales bacterium]|nr:Zn-dependent hydrolase [Desulfobacterales bacterium]
MIKRLKENLVEASQYGRNPQRTVENYRDLDPESGVNRPEGTDANKELRDFAVGCMKAAGLKVSVDRVGNIFGRKEGLKSETGVVMCGSHLDSVLNGGHLDGALGVFAAIEAVRRIDEGGFENERPIEIVAFTGEEGSAFGVSLLGSSALTGKISTAEALAVKNDAGKTLGAVLTEIGYQGDIVRSLDDVDYFVEMHIEQGPILDNEKIPVGIVENITGIVWLTATIRGMANHAGTTPMTMRRDALVAAAEVVTFLKTRTGEIVDKLGSTTVGTVGKLDVFPNSTNVVPAKVRLGIDIRDASQDNMQQLTDESIAFINALESKHGVKTQVQWHPVHSPVCLSKRVIDTMEGAANQSGVAAKKINSGAGHDAQNMAAKVETGMIFVPSIDGISHSPMEWTAWKDIEKGTRVLTHTLKSLSCCNPK